MDIPGVAQSVRERISMQMAALRSSYAGAAANIAVQHTITLSSRPQECCLACVIMLLVVRRHIMTGGVSLVLVRAPPQPQGLTNQTGV